MSHVKRNGFTLIELMIVVAIVGVLSVIAIFGVRKYIANAKTLEARAVVGQIAKNAMTAFEKESGGVNTVALGTEGTAANRALCSGTTNAVPDQMAKIANRKYQSHPAEWRTGNATTGWSCLGFMIDNPQYFQYQYSGNNVDFRTGTFAVVAHGDLNGDNVTSTFTLVGGVDMGQARIAPTMDEVATEE